jgi:hypothetical protein
LNTLVNFQSAQPSKTGQFSIGVNNYAKTCMVLDKIRSFLRLLIFAKTLNISISKYPKALAAVVKA